MTKPEMIKAYMKRNCLSIGDVASATGRKAGYMRRIIYNNAPIGRILEHALTAAYPDIFLPADVSKPTIESQGISRIFKIGGQP